MTRPRFALGSLAAIGAMFLWHHHAAAPAQEPDRPATQRPGVPADTDGILPTLIADPKQSPPPLPAFVERGLDWLAGAQQQDGGWGGGSHANQGVRDAHAVPTDPATTAVAAMALLRAGSHLDRGPFHQTLQRAVDYLLTAVEGAAAEGPRITDRNGTQPQAKLGQNVDTALTAQLFARLLHDLAADAPQRTRVAAALDKCLRKIESSQGADGNWSAGGWAAVLQASQMATALELGQQAGRPVDQGKLDQARDYQRKLAGAPAGSSGAAGGGRLALGEAAGVALYASAANMRAVAAESRAAEELVAAARAQGQLPQSATVSREALDRLGLDADRAATLADSYAMNTAAKARAFDEGVLQGFGNNGGEEYLSYQMKSESLAIDGGADWQKWQPMIEARLAKVQNQDGSWSGHHCITSPVFCTATAIACLTADRDVEWLRSASRNINR